MSSQSKRQLRGRCAVAPLLVPSFIAAVVVAGVLGIIGPTLRETGAALEGRLRRAFTSFPLQDVVTLSANSSYAVYAPIGPAAYLLPVAPVGRSADGSLLSSLKCSGEPGGAMICAPTERAPSWDDVRAACASAEPVGRGDSVFMLRALHWTALRMHAYADAVVGDSSSTFPFTTVFTPWDAQRATSVPWIMRRHRLLKTHAWYFDDRFEVLLNASRTCELATALAARDSGGAGVAAERAGHLVTSTSYVLGVAPRVPAIATSSFWSVVAARATAAPRVGTPGDIESTAVDDDPVGGSANPSNVAVALRACSALRSGNSGSSMYATEVCNRHWSAHSAIRAALSGTLHDLFTEYPSMTLHNGRSLLQHLPTLGTHFRRNDRIYVGAATGNASVVNRGFNPPEVHALSGSYLTAFNVLVTPHGAIQRPPGAPRPPPLGSMRRHAPTQLPTHGLLYHTTCEGREDDMMRDVSYRDRGADLPTYDEVVVITHRGLPRRSENSRQC